MLQASLRLYKNAYSGLSPRMWWLALVIFINRCGTMVIPFLTLYLTQNGFSYAQAGYVMAAFGCGSIVGAFVGGRLTDRFGHYAIQVASLFLNGIGFIVLGQMHSFWQITICIFVLSSLGEAFRPANSAAIAAYSTEQNRTRCYALNRLAVNLGWAIGPALGGILADINYQLLFWTDGLTCMIAAVMLYFLFSAKNAPAESHHEEKVNSVKSAWKDTIFLTGMLYVFLVGLCFFQMASFLPVFYKTFVHLDEFAIGLILASNGLIIVAFEMVMVYSLENKRHVVTYLSLGAFLIGVAFMILEIAPLLPIVMISMIVITIGEMLLFAFMNNFWVKRSNPATRGQYASVYTMSFSAAIVLAPTLAAQIATRFGFSTLWVFNFGVCSLAALGYLMLKKRINSNERI